MTYKEQQELVADLRLLADFYERPEAIALPTMYLSEYTNVTKWDWNDDNSKYEPNLEATKDKMRKIAKALGNCKKEFDNGSLRLVKNINDRIRLTYTANREAYCKKVPTGKTRVIPASEERIEEVYEWVCDDPVVLR
jgi:hypothetical protein